VCFEYTLEVRFWVVSFSSAKCDKLPRCAEVDAAVHESRVVAMKRLNFLLIIVANSRAAGVYINCRHPSSVLSCRSLVSATVSPLTDLVLFALTFTSTFTFTFTIVHFLNASRRPA